MLWSLKLRNGTYPQPDLSARLSRNVISEYKATGSFSYCSHVAPWRFYIAVSSGSNGVSFKFQIEVSGP
jgi:hypothetical protein